MSHEPAFSSQTGLLGDAGSFSSAPKGLRMATGSFNWPQGITPQRRVQERSYSVEVEAENIDGDEISIEVTVETAADLPAAVTIAQAAAAALPAGYSADVPDTDE